MPTPDAWKRRYERAEAERLRLAAELDEAKQQVTAIEQIALTRALLVGIERDGRRVIFTFSRRGQVHRCETYGTWDQPVEQWRKELVE